MPSEGPSVPPSGAGPGGIAPAQPREGRDRIVSLPPTIRRRLPNGDPYDIDAAIERLTQLLAADENTPRVDVPPGFYINILV